MTNNALNVFVTGATTAAGREVVRQLSARGHKVTGLTVGSDGAAKVRQDGGLPTYSDPLRAGELKSLLRMMPYDVVIHLEPQVANCFPIRTSDWDGAMHTVAASTSAITEAAAETGVKFLVHSSFAFAYGDTHGEWVTEDSQPHGSAFRAALQAEKRVLGGSVPACVLRAGLVYSGEDAAVAAIGTDIRRGRGIYMGDSHAALNWIHAADLAQAAVLAAEQQLAGQIFNVVDDQPSSAAAFVGHLSAALGMGEAKAMNVPEFALNILTSAAQRTLLNTSARAKNDKARQVLGWTPKYLTHTAGLEQTLLIWRAEAK